MKQQGSKTNISFEFFPPKTELGFQQLRNVAQTLALCHPRFYSVTFGAGGSTRVGTLNAVEILAQQTGVTVAPHLACIGASKSEMVDTLRQYRMKGIKRIVALRGDIPSGMVQSGDFKYACELIPLIREELGDSVHIEVAAYPEMHPQAVSFNDDVLNLKRKQDAGANGAITQYFFNPDAYFHYLDDCQKNGVTIPIVPGIMPITQFSSLLRFSSLCGAEIPQWIRCRLESFVDDIASIQAFGLDVVSELCQHLLAGGAPGLHFYTLNKAEPTLAILQHLGVDVALSDYHSRVQLGEVMT